MATAAEFAAYIAVYDSVPDLTSILEGDGAAIAFPAEPSVRYATTIGLTLRADSPQQSLNGFRWMADSAETEWTQLYAIDLLRLARVRGQVGIIATLAQSEPRLQRYFKDYTDLLTSK